MKLHHVGVVTDNIDLSIQRFSGFGFVPVSNVVRDVGLGVDVVLLGSSWAHENSESFIELIKPCGHDARKGLAHLCFEADDVEASMEQAKRDGARVVCGPVEAVLFGGRRVGFVFVRDGFVVEFLEKGIP